MQGFVMRVNPPLNALSGCGLKQPVKGGGSVENDHSALRSSCTFLLYKSGGIELDGDGLALMETGAELGQSWPLCDLFNLGEQIV